MPIYAKLIILFTPKLQFSPYSEIIHGRKHPSYKSLTKVRKMINYSI